MDYIAAAMDMRQKAWAAIVASPHFVAFRAADNMVVDLGGQSIMPNLSTSSEGAQPSHKINPRPRVRGVDGKPRMTQTEVAIEVLKESGPLGIVMLTDMARDKGAVIGGSNPIANFRSALSKDERFYSFRHDGEHYWWLTDVSLPEGWKRAVDDLVEQATALDHSNQEGGDGHAANNTNLVT